MTAPEVYKSTARDIEDVPMTDGRQYTYWSAYSIFIPNLKTGDVVDLRARFQVDNPQNYNAQVTYYIARGEPYGDTMPSLSADLVMPVGGDDEAPHGHYNRIVLAIDRITGPVGDREYSLILETASTAVTPGAALRLNSGYGGIEALVYRA